MGFFDKIFGWMKKAFNIVDHVIGVYEEIKQKLPGLIEFMEQLYDSFRPRVEDSNDPMTGEDAASEVVNLTANEFTNSPLTLPRSFLKYVLELIHMKKQEKKTAYYDRPDVRKKANKVLRGLRNRYDER